MALETDVGGRALPRGRRRGWALLRGTGCLAVLTVLGVRLGTRPFLDGLRLAVGWPVAAALVVTAVSTVCCAWRWRLVAAALGLDVRLHTAVTAYYRSQLLNVALPGGVLGDVHRGLDQGRRGGDLGRGVRAVVWERSLGQLVTIPLTLAVLLAFPSPVRRPVAVWGAVAVLVGIAVVGAGLRARRATAGPAGLRATLVGDLRGILRPRAALGVAFLSSLALACHVALFLVAARASGAPLAAAPVVPVAVLVLLAAGVPLNVAGWGPREGVAAWAFGAVGLTPGQGVTTAVLFGVLVFVGTLPGVAVLLAVPLLPADRRAHRGGDADG